MGTFTFRNYTTYDNANAPNSIVIAKPTGTTENDIMFAFSSVTGGYMNTPTGWNLLGSMTSTSYFRLMYKIAGSSEATGYTFSSGASGRRTKLTIGSYYDGFDVSGNDYDVISNTQYNAGGAQVRAASMNVTNYNAPLLFIGGFLNTTTNRTVTISAIPTTWTEDVDNGTTTTGYWHFFAHIDAWNSVGSTGTAVATISGSPNVTNKHAFMVALIPSVSALQPRRRIVMITHL
jgi:hypothetical protein